VQRELIHFLNRQKTTIFHLEENRGLYALSNIRALRRRVFEAPRHINSRLLHVRQWISWTLSYLFSSLISIQASANYIWLG
jgi:hypothetical protein